MNAGAALPEPNGLYSPALMARHRGPAHHRCLPSADARGVAENRLCGDRIAVSLRLGPDGAVAEAAYEAGCCAIAAASAEAMAELAPGRDAAGLRALAAQFEAMLRDGEQPREAPPALREFIALRDYPARIGCATLPWQALLQALEQRTAP